MNLDLLLMRQANQQSARIFLSHPTRNLTYEQTEEEVGRLAGFFVSRGLSAGGFVHLMLPKCPELVTGFLATNRARGIAIPVNTKQPVTSLRDFFTKYVTRFIVVHAMYRDLLLQAIDGWAPQPVMLLVDDNCTSGLISYRSALTSTRIDAAEYDSNDASYLNFSSGSTGMPRAAVATHSQICWNTRSICEVFGFGPEDVHLPMFAVFAHPHEIFMRALWTGGSVVLHDHVYPRALAALAAEQGVSAIMAVATVYQLLLTPLTQQSLPKLRVAESGGMLTSRQLIDRFYSLTGRYISPVWGSTESCGPAIATRPGQVHPDGILGYRCPYYELRVVDERDEELPSDAPGELLVAGPGVTECYWNDDAATHQLLASGWYRTGDIVTHTSDGLFRFLSRTRQVIKVSGIKVYAREIEERIIQHPSVASCLVVADQDTLRGDVHRVLITPDVGKEFIENILYPYLYRHLPRYKVPRSICSVDEFPRLSGGKVDYEQALHLARKFALESQR